MATKSNRDLRLSIRITVVGMFLLMTTLTVAVAIGLQYYFTTSLAEESTLASYRQAASSTSEYINTMDRRARDATRLLSNYPGIVNESGVSEQTRELFAKSLRDNPLFYAIYIGFANGDFYELVNLNSSSVVRHQLQALPQDRWVIIQVSDEGGVRQRTLSYYDHQFTLRSQRSAHSDYRADKRPWFVHAEPGQVYKTPPYLFQHLQSPGQTYSAPIPGESSVLAIDIALASVSDTLQVHLLGDDSRIYLYQGSGELIATSEQRIPSATLPKSAPLDLTPEQQAIVDNTPVLAVSNEMDWPPFDFAIAGEPHGYAIDVLELVAEMTGLRFHYINGYSWPELLTMYRNGQIDILQPVAGTAQNATLGELSQAFVEAPIGVITRKGAPSITDIEQLEGIRVAIPKGWSIIAPIRETYPSINIIEVDGIKGMFDAVRNGDVDAGLDNAAILNYTARQFFLDDLRIHAPLDTRNTPLSPGLHFIVDPKHDGIKAIIDLALSQLTPKQRGILDARWIVSPGNPIQQRSTVPYPELLDLAALPALFNSLQRIQLEGREYFVYVQRIGETDQENYLAMLTPVSTVLAPAVSRVHMVLLLTGLCLLLLLPVSSWLATYIVDPVKHLALENEKIKQRHYDDLIPLRSRIAEIDDLATSMMSMAQSIKQHSKEQEALMDAFIQIIAQAIDDKSPYTAGHCARVPELAIMLAHQAEICDQAPFDNFHFANERARREFRIGAWLHDCGKITTPEHIVDKGTKLETIYNRIHEIRMRFEVLLRDAEIHYQQQCMHAQQDEPIFKQALEQRKEQLQEDFAFIASCNIGGEFMSDDDLERLQQLSRITWQRHFDDRVGLSPIECARYPDEKTTLPAEERLLADMPRHIIPRIRNNINNEHLGIRMDVPEHLYNLGELYNLSIQRGTLTTEDRFKINEHMISTIKMLDKLPLPDDLAQVPRYASTHHETLDGRGYPRKLIADDLSIPERIMVLADIFEALTAADRPYKDAKPISVTLNIMHRMVQDNHIDKDVFALFLRSGTHIEYARRYLPESKIDEIDIEQYLV